MWLYKVAAHQLHKPERVRKPLPITRADTNPLLLEIRRRQQLLEADANLVQQRRSARQATVDH